MKTERKVKAAVAVKARPTQNRAAKPEAAAPSTAPAVAPPPPAAAPAAAADDPPTPVTRLHVGGIPGRVTGAELQSLFSRVVKEPEAIAVDLRTDATTGLRRGFAYVQFGSGQDAQAAATALNGTRWKGSKLSLAPVKEGYLARLQREKAEVEAAAAAAAQERQRKPTPEGLTKLIKKGLPPRTLRIRKRVGQPPLLVDPVPRDASAASAEQPRRRKRPRPADQLLQAVRRTAFASANEGGASVRGMWREAEIVKVPRAALEQLARLEPELPGAGGGGGGGGGGGVGEEEEELMFVWDDDGGGGGGEGGGEDVAENGAGGSEGSDADGSDGSDEHASGAGGSSESGSEGEDATANAAVSHTNGAPSAGNGITKPTKGAAAAVAAMAAARDPFRKPMDESFLESSGDEGADAAGNGAFDYEAETAAEAAAATVAAPAAIDDAPLRQQLEEEARRSMAVLAKMFGGRVGAGGVPAHGGAGAAAAAATPQPAPAAARTSRFVAQVRFDPDAEPSQQVPVPVRVQRADVASRAPREAAAAAERRAGGGGAAEEAGRVVAAAEAPGSERFVARVAALTDIFNVQDKASAKMSQEERERATGFKLSSLFGGGSDGEGGGGGSDGGSEGRGAGGGDGAKHAFSFGGEGGEEGEEGGDSAPAVLHAKAGDKRKQAVTSGGKENAAAAGGRARGGGDAPQSIWGGVEAMRRRAALFCRQELEAVVEERWLRTRKNLTTDFKRKHKDALKSRGVGPRGRGRGGRR